MIDPKRVLRTLTEHWSVLEPLCERFDYGTLGLTELRQLLALQQPTADAQQITQWLDQLIRQDILVPVAKSPNRFELNPHIHDFLSYLRREHRLGLCLEIEVYLQHLARQAQHIEQAFKQRDAQELLRQLRLLDMRVRDVQKKLANDEHALTAVAERAKTSERNIPLRQRYAEVLSTWDEYVEPMITLVAADGLFERGVQAVEGVLLHLLDEQHRLGPLIDDDPILRVHARIFEMQASAQLTLRRARELLLPLREEARQHNAITRGAALALAAVRKRGIDALPDEILPLFSRPQSVFLGSASQVEAYVHALAGFKPREDRFPQPQGPRNSTQRAPLTVREMLARCQRDLPIADLMHWLIEQEPNVPSDELLYWFSRLSRHTKFQRQRLARAQYHTAQHYISLTSYALLGLRQEPLSQRLRVTDDA